MTNANMVRTFLRDERGAVTVDWVVLCAAMVGFVLAVAVAVEASITTGADNLSGHIQDGFAAVEVE